MPDKQNKHQERIPLATENPRPCCGCHLHKITIARRLKTANWILFSPGYLPVLLSIDLLMSTVALQFYPFSSNRCNISHTKKKLRGHH